MRQLAKYFLSFLWLCMTVSTALAQTDLQNRLFGCADVEDVLQRLACFDDLSRTERAGVDNRERSASTAPSAPAITDSPAPATPATPVVVRPVAPAAAPPAAETPSAPPVRDAADDVSTFGQPAETARVETDANGEIELVDTIIELRQVDPTRIEVTLASGQVWRQTVGKLYLLREGDSVRISGTNWGDEYRLSADGKRGYIQVRRVE